MTWEEPKRLAFGLQGRKMLPRRTNGHFHAHESCGRTSTAHGEKDWGTRKKPKRNEDTKLSKSPREDQ